MEILSKISSLAKPAANVLAKNSPKILLATGIAGFAATVAMAVKATPAAYDAHCSFEHDRKGYLDHNPEYTAEDDVKTAIRQSYLEEAKFMALSYLPAFLMGTGSVACVIASSRIQSKRGAAVLAAYSLAQETLGTYQEKVIEKLGEDKHKEIMQDVSDTLAERHRDEVPFDGGYAYLPGEDGTCLCYDRVTGRYFNSTKERIREAEGRVNKRLIDETIVRLSEFYYELGIEDHSFAAEALGWDVGKVKPDIYFTSMLDEQDRPCLVLNYNACLIEPRIFERGR